MERGCTTAEKDKDKIVKKKAKIDERDLNH